MESLLQAFNVSGFQHILLHYVRERGGDIGNMIDGGAGSGSTSSLICASGKNGNRAFKVYAYEPFVGNHRFFENIDEHIVLRKSALGECRSKLTLAVPAVVAEDSEWGRRGMVGYSSGGALTTHNPMGAHDFIVEVVPADDDIPKNERIGFVKLDLQGGEFQALKGMKRRLKDEVELVWIEYLFHPKYQSFRLLQQLEDDFILFDTEYLFKGEPSDEARELFQVSKYGNKLSNGSQVWSGFKKKSWRDFESQTAECFQKYGLIQTDLCCVKKEYLRPFLAALGAATGEPLFQPRQLNVQHY